MTFAFVIVLLTTFPYQISTQTSESRIVPFISNGNKAFLGQFPYVALLKTPESLCGGTILTDSKVLSAAHCVFSKAKRKFPARQIFITVGTIYESTRPYTRGESYMIHPRYKHEPVKGSAEFDISVIIVEKPFEFNEVVQPIPVTTHPAREGTLCVVAGFGVVAFEDKRVPGHLLYTHVTVNSLSYCQESFSGKAKITKEMICAGAFDKGDPCRGDSGSGLVCEGVVAGIVSFGVNCSSPGFPGVYMSVYHFRDWITQASAVSLFVTNITIILVTISIRYVLTESFLF